jgi:hypothetical protein
MGAGAPIAAGGLSLASMGLSAYGETLKAKGVAEGDIYKAETLERAATYGNLKATQTAGQMTRNLNVTLGNIDAIRAAARTDPSDPTGFAVRRQVEGIGMEQRDITVDSLKAQAQEDESNAAYLRQASAEAITTGNVSALADILKGLSGAAGGMGGGSLDAGGNLGPLSKIGMSNPGNFGFAG